MSMIDTVRNSFRANNAARAAARSGVEPNWYAAGAPAPGPAPPPTATGASAGEAAQALRARHDELAHAVAELHWDLGGLTYEMAIRDHFRLDVIVRKAAELQQLDAELGEVERLLAMQETATTGSCRSCGALHSRGAMFCWQCGAQLMAQQPSSALG